MCGFLIDPLSKAIQPVDYAPELRAIYELLGCRAIEAVRFDRMDGDITYFDEEELFKELAPDSGFKLPNITDRKALSRTSVILYIAR